MSAAIPGWWLSLEGFRACGTQCQVHAQGDPLAPGSALVLPASVSATRLLHEGSLSSLTPSLSASVHHLVYRLDQASSFLVQRQRTSSTFVRMRSEAVLTFAVATGSTSGQDQVCMRARLPRTTSALPSKLPPKGMQVTAAAHSTCIVGAYTPAYTAAA